MVVLTENRTETWCEVSDASREFGASVQDDVASDRQVGDRYQAESCMIWDRTIEVRETTFTPLATAIGVGLVGIILVAALLAVVLGAVSIARQGRSGDGERKGKRKRKAKPGLIDERFTGGR